MRGGSVAQGRFSFYNLNYIHNLNSMIPSLHQNSLYLHSQLNSVKNNYAYMYLGLCFSFKVTAKIHCCTNVFSISIDCLVWFVAFDHP